MIKFDFKGFQKELGYTTDKLSELLGVTINTIYMARHKGGVLKQFAYDIQNKFPKLYKKYKG